MKVTSHLNPRGNDLEGNVQSLELKHTERYEQGLKPTSLFPSEFQHTDYRATIKLQHDGPIFLNRQVSNKSMPFSFFFNAYSVLLLGYYILLLQFKPIIRNKSLGSIIL